MGAPTPSNSSSSGEEDGDAEWKAAIDSVVVSSHFSSNGFSALDDSKSKTFPTSTAQNHGEDGQYCKPHTQKLKHYQIKAQKVLDEILERNMEFVQEPIDVHPDEPSDNEGGVRLFRKAPPGIVFEYTDDKIQGLTKRPKILPGIDTNEKSKEFKRRLQAVAVDGFDIMTAAKNACQKSLARLEAKDAAAKAAAKKEEERVAELKRIRGERWLPSIAREMSVKFRS